MQEDEVGYDNIIRAVILQSAMFRWDRLSILMDRLNQYQEQFSYYLATKERSVLAKQV